MELVLRSIIEIVLKRLLFNKIHKKMRNRQFHRYRQKPRALQKNHTCTTYRHDSYILKLELRASFFVSD